MSRSGSLLALALALFVGAGAWWLLVTQRVASKPPERLLEFSPSDIEGMHVRNADSVQAVVRDDSGEWALLPGPVASAAAWPVNPGNVRAALSVLADIRFEVAADPGETPDAPSIRLDRADGMSMRIEFPGQPVGGRTLAVATDAESERRAGFVDASIREMLLNPGPRGWRVMTAMPGVGVEVSRVRISTPTGELLLGQVAGKWSLREPVGARADDAAVQNLLATLTSLQIERFVDDGVVDPDAAGLREPKLRIIAATDARVIGDDGEVSVRTTERTLSIGGAADMEGNLLFASPDLGTTIFTIAAHGLRALPTDPLACIARSATGVLPSNVGMAHIRFPGGAERGCRRGLDGWDELATDGRMLPLEMEPVQDMLDFLSARIPPTVRILELGEQAGAPWATVTLFGFADEPLDTVELVMVDGAPGALNGRVLRVYAPGEWPALLTPEGLGAGVSGTP